MAPSETHSVDILGRVWTEQDNANRAYVVARLAYNGPARVGKVAADQVQLTARMLADGFGPSQTEEAILWDWSHVRDSSPQACAVMAKFLQHVEAYA